MDQFTVTFCHECNSIDVFASKEKKCPCSGSLKSLKCFNSKEEAENYASYLRVLYKFS